MANYSSVVIVGRTNVGKSTLFNRLAPSVRSIAFDQEGVTRDSIKDVVTWKEFAFHLVDTGGVSLRPTKDAILEAVRTRALELLEHAAVVVFVCDGTVGVLQEDSEIAKLLHKLGKKVVLVVNKIDTKLAQERLHEFERLGMKSMVSVSAQHGSGTIELLDAITGYLAARPAVQKMHKDQGCKAVLLGKPNVGKSSLMNLLVGQERSIVADIPGTTRESVSETIRFYQAEVQITDTAGVRRKRSVGEDPLESLMVKSSLDAVDASDIVLLLIDASAGVLADQELKLAFFVLERFKALIILFNKQDLATEETSSDLVRSCDEYKHLMKKVPSLAISCTTGKNVGRVLPLIDTVWQRHNQQFESAQLSMLLKTALVKKPLYYSGNLLRLHAVEQVATAPITILLHVNEAAWWGPTQLGYLENVLRKEYSLQGVPVRFLVRKRKR